MCLSAFYDDYDSPLNVVQLMLSEVLMFHENIELLTSGDSYDIYLGNIDSSERITLFHVGVDGNYSVITLITPGQLYFTLYV